MAVEQYCRRLRVSGLSVVFGDILFGNNISGWETFISYFFNLLTLISYFFNLLELAVEYGRNRNRMRSINKWALNHSFFRCSALWGSKTLLKWLSSVTSGGNRMGQGPTPGQRLRRRLPWRPRAAAAAGPRRRTAGSRATGAGLAAQSCRVRIRELFRQWQRIS